MPGFIDKGCLTSLERKWLTQLVLTDVIESHVMVSDSYSRFLQLQAFEVVVRSVHLDTPELEGLIVLELFDESVDQFESLLGTGDFVPTEYFLILLVPGEVLWQACLLTDLSRQVDPLAFASLVDKQ